MEGHQKFPGEEGLVKAKILEANYEATCKLEFPGGRGCKKLIFGGGGGSMDIFLKYTILNIVV